jgi:hypothetical protein
MTRQAILLSVFVLALAACSAAARSASTVPVSNAAADVVAISAPADPPIDRSLRPISLSSMSGGDKDAFTRCVREGEEKLVAGMALLSSAREVPRYGWWFGNSPELQTDIPAWVVQFAGDVPSRFGIYHDPTCVVIDGVESFFVTNGMTALDGTKTERSELAKPPELRLPPLEP